MTYQIKSLRLGRISAGLVAGSALVFCGFSANAQTFHPGNSAGIVRMNAPGAPSNFSVGGAVTARQAAVSRLRKTTADGAALTPSPVAAPTPVGITPSPVEIKPQPSVDPFEVDPKTVPPPKVEPTPVGIIPSPKDPPPPPIVVDPPQPEPTPVGILPSPVEIKPQPTTDPFEVDPKTVPPPKVEPTPVGIIPSPKDPPPPPIVVDPPQPEPTPVGIMPEPKPTPPGTDPFTIDPPKPTGDLKPRQKPPYQSPRGIGPRRQVD